MECYRPSDFILTLINYNFTIKILNPLNIYLYAVTCNKHARGMLPSSRLWLFYLHLVSTIRMCSSQGLGQAN